MSYKSNQWCNNVFIVLKVTFSKTFDFKFQTRSNISAFIGKILLVNNLTIQDSMLNLLKQRTFLKRSFKCDLINYA